jgi:opacity protein-like surface antigen
MHNNRTRIRTFLLAAGLLAAAGTTPGAAQDFTRQNKQDIYVLFQTINAKQLDYRTDSGVVPLSMDTTYLGGLGFGYHFYPSLAGRFEVAFGNTVLHGRGPAQGTSRQVWMNSGMFNLDWNMLDRRITPYLTGGIGWQYVEAQLSNTPVPTVYWDPWWGYTGTTSYPVYSETDLVLSLGLGVRWDVTDHFFLRLSADASRINYVNISGYTTLIKYGFIIGAAY